jgi:diaminopimelate decarboxylase
MASRYNSRQLPPEVLVRGSSFELVNSRETFEQAIAGERVPSWLQ